VCDVSEPQHSYKPIDLQSPIVSALVCRNRLRELTDHQFTDLRLLAVVAERTTMWNGLADQLV
jgi:hypothetical protein